MSTMSPQSEASPRTPTFAKTLAFDLQINRVHSLLIVNMSAKFEEDAHNDLVYRFQKSKRGTQTGGLPDKTTAEYIY